MGGVTASTAAAEMKEEGTKEDVMKAAVNVKSMSAGMKARCAG